MSEEELILEEDYYRKVAKIWDDYIKELRRQGAETRGISAIVKNKNIKKYMEEDVK